MFETYIPIIIAFLPKLVLALAIMLVAWLVGRFIASIIYKMGKTGKLGRANVYQLLASVTKMVCIVFGLITALGTIGVNVMPLVAGLGITGLAAGLAAKDTVTNLLNGILILIYQPFKEGDTIKIASSKGRVGEINLRYIQLIDEEEGKEYLVPNSLAMSKEIVKDWKPKHETKNS